MIYQVVDSVCNLGKVLPSLQLFQPLILFTGYVRKQLSSWVRNSLKYSFK